MANKNCTPSLIKKKRKHISLFRALFKKGTDNGFYTAVSNDGRTTIWWIEANQLGSTSCYPCVIYHDGEELAFVSGRSTKEKNSNKKLIEKWNSLVTPENIDTDYIVTEMQPEEFFRQFNPAEDRQMARLFAPKKEEKTPDEGVAAPELSEKDDVKKDEGTESDN